MLTDRIQTPENDDDGDDNAGVNNRTRTWRVVRCANDEIRYNDGQ